MAHVPLLAAVLFSLFTGLATDLAHLSVMVAAAGALAVVAVMAWAARLGGVDAESAPFWRIARLGGALIQRAGAAWVDSISVARHALAADVTLNPALLRVRMRARGPAARAAFAHLVGAAPGVLVVDMDEDGLLAHVIDEAAIDASELAALETRVLRTLERAP